MAQAKRKKTARKPVATRHSFKGLGMLVLGIAIGSLATILWQGTKSADGGIGTGIRQMMDASRKQDENQQRHALESVREKPQLRETNYDFYTKLPEIEVVVSEDFEPNPPSQPAVPAGQRADPEQKSDETEGAASGERTDREPPAPGSVYMLQAASYRNDKAAERLKAQLALGGLESRIQKVTIQGRGDYFRVRLGPYQNYKEMESVAHRLAEKGIDPIRLKVSKRDK